MVVDTISLRVEVAGVDEEWIGNRAGKAVLEVVLVRVKLKPMWRQLWGSEM